MKRMGFIGLAVALLMSCGFASAEVPVQEPGMVASHYVDQGVGLGHAILTAEVAVQERLCSQPVAMIANVIPSTMVAVGAGYAFQGVTSPTLARISARTMTV